MRWIALLGVCALLGSHAGAGEKDNTAPPGFTALFNGKDMTGWEGAINIEKRLKLSPDDLKTEQEKENKRILPHWRVENGALINDGKGYNLATVKHYRNFELMVDWKIEPKGDSGIYVRGLPQIQIWDSDSLDPKRYKLEFAKGSGAVWNNAKPEDKVPLKRTDRSPGQWNSFHITMKGAHLDIKLNGELVVKNTAIENIWIKERSKGPERGPVELQQHPKQDGKHGDIAFKNIYIKELPD